MEGIDLSPEMIGVAARLNSGIWFRVGDIEHLDVPDRTYAGVVLRLSVDGQASDLCFSVG